jgi:DNA polymerase-1
VNCSIINGQTPYGLAHILKIELSDAEIILNDFRNRYPRVAEWIDESVQVAKHQGYVTSFYGRRRYLPDLNADNPFVRAQAERQVVSGIIQSTAADIFKWMLGRLYQKLPSEFKMSLPIHDAILFEIPENRVEKAKKLISEIMQERPPRFSIPLVANIGIGRSWGECC